MADAHLLQQIQRDLEALLGYQCHEGTISQVQQMLLAAWQAGVTAGTTAAIQRVSSIDERERLRAELLPPERGTKRHDRQPW